MALVQCTESFAAAADGGMYLVWSGGIVAGVATLVRGRSLVERARREFD
jgi:hypothetical protein